MKCNACGFDNDSDAEFCENCGSPLAQVCPHCNTPLKPGASYCKKCGNPVGVEKTTSGAGKPPEKPPDPTHPQQEVKAQVSPTQLEGERKPTTILFTDIVGSTTLAEKIDPEEWKEIVSGAHQRVIAAIHRYGGTVAQLLGDGVLAFFGAPVTHEDDPVRAVKAALDIQQEISKYAFELRGYVDDFQMRMGLNTGMVVAGNVGSELHMEYLAIGDAVNLAARLQSSAQPGKVLISENTARRVRAAFELIDLGEITVKGKAKPVRVYEVHQPKAAPESGRGFEELDSPLVGRSKELAELNQALDELCNGHGQIVAILGEAGIGKSRLVEEARCNFKPSEQSIQHPEMCELHWIEGRALSYGATLSFWTISQLIKADLGLSDADPEPRIHVNLGRRLNTLFGEQSDQVFPYLGHLLGVKLDRSTDDHINLLDGETLRRQTLISLTKYFEKMAQSRPTVAIFEDLHWADPSSLEALELVLAVTDRAPLMILLLSRLEREQASWQIKLKAETEFPHRYTEIQLKPLSPSQQNQLVDNLLNIAELPASLREIIQEHAEGNPFYLEEIIRSLIEQGAVVREADHWKATQEISDVTIPDTLQGVLLARLDRLQEDVRRTLQLASVIGRSFLYSILEGITEAEQQLDEHLTRLQRLDLVREKARLPELEYMFKHSLTQEAAYSSLLVARRREFHQKVGETLEKLFSERLEEFYGILAHHFEAAKENARAIKYLTRAGEKARSMAELPEAIGYYQRIIALLSETGDVDRLARAWLKLGLVYCTNFQFDEAYQANEQAFALQKRAVSEKRVQVIKKPEVLHISKIGSHFTLDPGEVNWEMDCRIASNLFSGLVQLDHEANIVPDVARSWQVLDGGRRYLFNLRDDARWSDGSAVVAQDFEYALKRNLQSIYATVFSTAQLLFDIEGGQDYCEGRNPDPDSIGVHAYDPYTLEIRLVAPVAYFPYILSMPIASPLPRKTIEQHGGEWWKSGSMLSNGPYQLVEFDTTQGSVIERNPYYHGDFEGNVQRVQLKFSRDSSHLNRLYRENAADIIFIDTFETLDTLPGAERTLFPHPRSSFIVFAAAMEPLTDVRVRKALAHALNLDELTRKFRTQKSSGGLIPPGIPGHTPDIGWSFDPQAAQQLLVEAGYPGGKGMPTLTGLVRLSSEKWLSEIACQWHENLGIETSIQALLPYELMALKAEAAHFHLVLTGWIFDYPDPDNILGQPYAFLDIAHMWGWHDETYLNLVKEAGRTANLAKRMAAYRQADRMLIQDHAIVLPINYGAYTCTMVKPWVKNLQITPSGRILLKDVTVEEH